MYCSFNINEKLLVVSYRKVFRVHNNKGHISEQEGEFY